MEERKVLLIIDAQNGFKNENTEDALERIDEISDYFDDVFASMFFNPDDSMYQKVLFWNKFNKHKDKDCFEVALKNKDHLQFYKTHRYGQIEGDFKKFLEKNKVKKVYLCGLDTDANVLKTALDLFDMDIEPVIIKDACASYRGDDFHNAAILIAERQIGEDNVVTFDELEDRLEHKTVELF